jgi:hypothetical protein
MKTFHIILCIVDLIVFVGFLIAPEVWTDIFFVLFIFTAIMLITLGIFLLSMPDDKEDFDLSDTLTCHHPFVQWLRRHHGVD